MLTGTDSKMDVLLINILKCIPPHLECIILQYFQGHLLGVARFMWSTAVFVVQCKAFRVDYPEQCILWLSCCSSQSELHCICTCMLQLRLMKFYKWKTIKKKSNVGWILWNKCTSWVIWSLCISAEVSSCLYVLGYPRQPSLLRQLYWALFNLPL